MNFQYVELDAFEIDDNLIPHLSHTLKEYSHSDDFVFNIHKKDFIHSAVKSLSGKIFPKASESYTHTIINPPYKKINSNAAHRFALRQVGIETVNLYSAFVALVVSLSASSGQIVAIIPRSFCNGPYYRPFRDFILERTAIRHIHLFNSRSKAFKDDGVLQENIIIWLERDGQQGSVTVSTSTDDTFADIVTHEHLFERIVLPDNPERFIHIPTSPEKNAIELLPSVRYTIVDLGIKVSTGPVVDFRLKAYLRDMPEQGSVPLLYPAHFTSNGTIWPIEGMKKPNAIMWAETEKWLYPTGSYCVVRRFSAKEEQRRVVASVVDPRVFGDVSMLGFENHLNVFHEDKHGLSEEMAEGLAVFLNTTAVDEHFRSFSGHTQVNATDLKFIKYPSRDVLIGLGEWAMQQESLTQAMIDAKLGILTG